MKRKTRKFLDCAKESLILGVEIFNRPSEVGRVEGVLLTMNHAFEMLLKAVVFEKTGRIARSATNTTMVWKSASASARRS